MPAPTTPQNDALMTEPEAAAVVRVAASTLKDWRIRNRNPRPIHVKVGALIRYRKVDLDAFIEAQSVKESAS